VVFLLFLILFAMAFIAIHLSPVANASDKYISGTVTDESSGLPLEKIVVEVWTCNSQGDVGGIAARVKTSSSGQYEAACLHTESEYFKVWFGAFDGVHLSEYYNNKSNIFIADMIRVYEFAGGIDAQLRGGSAIHGMVTGEDSGAPIENCVVNAYDSSSGQISTTKTDSSGQYELGNLYSGEYKILFDPNDGYHGSEWYDNKQSQAEATTLTVVPPENINNIDASLPVGGRLTGTVVEDSTGLPISNCEVSVHEANIEGKIAVGKTDSTGYYDIKGLDTGDYKIKFEPAQKIYFSEWFDNKGYHDSATPVSIAVSSTKNINASLRFGGSISGVVTDEQSHKPVANCKIDVCDFVSVLHPVSWTQLCTTPDSCRRPLAIDLA
jgi:protocatechuate 3,4-dioxygenase beta subunit